MPTEYQNRHIKGSVNIPLYFVRRQLSKLKPGVPYVVACDTGTRSAAATYILRQQGFEAYVLKGGLQASPLGPP